MERRLMALAEKDERSKDEVREDNAKAKAVIAAKACNLQVRCSQTDERQPCVMEA